MNDSKLKREQLIQYISTIKANMNAENCNDLVRKQINQLEKDMSDDFFTIVVVGEFKRGKTSFVNALLGENLLITDVLPETDTIQAIMYNEEKKAEVIYKDKTVCQGGATRDFLSQFSAKQTENARKVSYIKIGFPSKFIKENIVLVDTPGVSDLDEQRVQVTYDFIPKANVVLFVLDATSPLKRSEKEFIEEHLFNQGIDNVIFILNKMDLFDEDEDLDDYLKTVHNRIVNAFKDREKLPEIVVIPVSSYMALKGIETNNTLLYEESNISKVRGHLQQMIVTGDIEQIKLSRYKERFMMILSDWKNKVGREISISEENTIAIKDQLQRIQQTEESYNTRYDIVDRYVEREKEFIFAMISKSLAKFYQDLSDDIKYEIDRYQGTEFKSFIERDIPHLIKKRTEVWMQSRFTGVEKTLNQLDIKLSEALSRYFNKRVFIQTMQEEFVIKPHMEMTAQDVSSSTISAGVVTATGLVTLSLLGLPYLSPIVSMAVFPTLRKSFLMGSLKSSKEEVMPQIEEEMKKFFTQLEDQIRQSIITRIHDMTSKVQANWERYMEDYKKSIQRCLEAKEDSKRDLEQQMIQKKQLYKNMDLIMNAINKL